MKRLLVLLVLAACGAHPRTPSTTPGARADNLRRHIDVLASDRFEGRAPGSVGDDLTVAYLDAELKKLGLTPEVQAVPMVALTARPSLDIDGAPLRAGDDFVAWSYAPEPLVKVDRSELVFVGYGVDAPELGWDDFKGVDLHGKTAVFLVGDPPVKDPNDPSKLDEKTFGGSAMTYYGRWTYKYEVAARRGAVAALIVHETAPAGYGWNVVSGGGARERYELATEEARSGHVPVEGWLHETRARALFDDFDKAKASAVSRDFRPVALAKKATLEVRSTARDVRSRNVVAHLAGSDPTLRREHVIYSAHWDHFGRGADGQIFHGALDNASGTAWLLETARLFSELPRRPARSLVFIAFTAEEQGLLGSKYYAAHPLYPLADAAADINMDIMNPWGRTRSIVSIGQGQTTMDELLAEEAARQGRTVIADPEPEKGYYFRSDHFELVKKGVPALSFLFPGADYIGKPPDFGAAKRQDYVARMYHQPLDVPQSDWDLGGTVEDTDLLFAVGLHVANGARPAFRTAPR